MAYSQTVMKNLTIQLDAWREGGDLVVSASQLNGGAGKIIFKKMNKNILNIFIDNKKIDYKVRLE